jgi:hypothetical protein
MKIRIEKPEEDSIKLRDCEPGELVRLADGSVCLVVDAAGIVNGRYIDGGNAAVWLKDGWVQMYYSYFVAMKSGKGPYRIVERLGKMTVERDER